MGTMRVQGPEGGGVEEGTTKTQGCKCGGLGSEGALPASYVAYLA